MYRPDSSSSHLVTDITLDLTEDAATSVGAPVVPRRGGWSGGTLSYAEFERQAVEFARVAALASQVRGRGQWQTKDFLPGVCLRHAPA
jgi:hypothetical protein